MKVTNIETFDLENGHSIFGAATSSCFYEPKTLADFEIKVLPCAL